MVKAKLGYLYYGIFHTKNNGFAANAKTYDFYGHFINPEITFRPNQSMDFKLKGDIQFFNYNHQKLSNNYGGTFTATRYLESKQGSANLHIAYLQKRYTNSYTSTDTTTGIVSTQPLSHLDADTWSYGMGGTYSGKMWPASLTLDYTFNDENTVKTNVKAQESRYKEHAFRADIMLPFTGSLSRFSLLGNASYSDKKYNSIVAARQLYTDVASNQEIKATLTTFGIKLQAMLWKKAGLTGSVGYEQTKSSSNTTSLTYKSKKYLGQLSASY